jgi:hypothetical protein
MIWLKVLTISLENSVTFLWLMPEFRGHAVPRNMDDSVMPDFPPEDESPWELGTTVVGPAKPRRPPQGGRAGQRGARQWHPCRDPAWQRHCTVKRSCRAKRDLVEIQGTRRAKKHGGPGHAGLSPRKTGPRGSLAQPLSGSRNPATHLKVGDGATLGMAMAPSTGPCLAKICYVRIHIDQAGPRRNNKHPKKYPNTPLTPA